MFKATKDICKIFDENDINYGVEKDDEKDAYAVIAGITTELTEFDIMFISQNDDNDVAMRVYDFFTFKPKKMTNMLKLVNRFNNEFRYLRFSIEEDNSVTLAYDFLMSCPNPGEKAFELFVLLCNVADEVYKQLMNMTR